jgi:hypothetical protein
MKEYICNPFLPYDEYIPDGEPHVFGDRVYLYGSHDKEAGNTFCILDYVVYSAPIDDLKKWKREGISYSAKQDPLYHKNNRFLYAPDVVKGNDGRYYLYYCMSGMQGTGGYSGPVSVAVCDSPCGKFEYLGTVKDETGRPYVKHCMFDPALINDDGVIRLYSGTRFTVHEAQYTAEETKRVDELIKRGFQNEELSLENIADYYGAYTCTLADDMLTMTTPMKLITPVITANTSWEGHSFFEANSIRKIDGKYYFIYSSSLMHELCYAVSDYPDKDFVCKGTIISNADIGYGGRKGDEAANLIGNNHGSIERINGQWYVFYHRHTHGTAFSRQACAERIEILPDGTIPQVRMTSCGLNGRPLDAVGEYPAIIACIVTNRTIMANALCKSKNGIPKITNSKDERYISCLSDGSIVGFREFSFEGDTYLSINVRGTTRGVLTISDDKGELARIEVGFDAISWIPVIFLLSISGVHSLYFTYTGKGRFDMLSIRFDRNSC